MGYLMDIFVLPSYFFGFSRLLKTFEVLVINV